MLLGFGLTPADQIPALPTCPVGFTLSTRDVPGATFAGTCGDSFVTTPCYCVPNQPLMLQAPSLPVTDHSTPWFQPMLQAFLLPAKLLGIPGQDMIPMNQILVSAGAWGLLAYVVFRGSK